MGSCIIERKYVGKRGKTSYKYFYYFRGRGKIGVAVTDRPTGPFRDALGRPC